ncbi:MAG: hypothetical protein R3F59_36690 [Myxococcota bacterium]
MATASSGRGSGLPRRRAWLRSGRGGARLLLCVRAEVEAALGDRGSAALVLEEAGEIAQAMGVGPSPFGAELAGADGAGPAGTASLRVAEDGSRFELGGASGELGRRHAIRRCWRRWWRRGGVLPGRALDVEQLFAAGCWVAPCRTPRERVYHAVGTLRRLGLGEVLERDEGGWRLAASVPVELC